MRRQFATLDVFTDRRFAGNPLAVVLEAEGLAAAAMQAIAREFGHPETVFVLTPGDRSHRARLRIFTPARELPFAGHPTVGTAVLLGLRDGKAVDSAMVLQEDIGPVRCTVEPGSGGQECALRHSATTGASRRSAERCSDRGRAAARADRDRLRATPARALVGRPPGYPGAGREPDCGRSLPPRSLAFRCRIRRWSGLRVLRRVRRSGSRLPRPDVRANAGRGRGSGDRIGCRRVAGLYAAGGDLAEGPHAVVIEQGYEMGRPSEIRLAMEVGSGKLVSATIGGDAVVVTEGTIEA